MFTTTKLVWAKRPIEGTSDFLYRVFLDDGTWLSVEPDGKWQHLDVNAEGLVVIETGIPVATRDPQLAGKAAAESYYDRLRYKS